MANKLYEESSVSAIAAAIRRKNGQATTYTVAEMAPAIDAINTGYIVTNGVIEQYKAATSAIPADTFVELTSGAASGMTITSETLITGGGSSDGYSSPVLLEQNKVFVTSSSSGQLYASICTVSNNTITRESLEQLSTSSSSGDYAQAIALTPTSVFVAYRNGTKAYAMICTISGTTITPGTGVQILSDYKKLSLAKLSDTKVLAVSGVDPVAVVCTISGTTITVGTGATLDNAYYVSSDAYYARYQLVALSSTSVFVAYRKAIGTGTQYESLSTMVCSIAGDVVTPGSATAITANLVGDRLQACALDSNRIFLAYRDTVEQAICGTICTIAGSAITFSTPTSVVAYNGSPISVVALDASLVCLSHDASSSSAITACTISNGTITAGVSTNFATSYYNIGSVALSPAKVFLSTVKSNTRGCIAYSDIVVQSSQTKIDGLTAENITTSTAGDVWVLNTA